MGKGNGSGLGGGRGSGTYKGKSDRIAVPAMPMPMAIICCVLNFIFPGFGTAVAGLSLFFCARNEDMDSLDKCFGCSVNAGLGCLQLFATMFFFFGWFWSCLWGFYFIVSSSENYKNNNPDDEDGQPEAVIVNQPGQTGIVVQHPPQALILLQRENRQTGTQVVPIEPSMQPYSNSLPPPYEATSISNPSNSLPPTYEATAISNPSTKTFNNTVFPSN